MGLSLRLFAPHICERKSSRTSRCDESHVELTERLQQRVVESRKNGYL